MPNVHSAATWIDPNVQPSVTTVSVDLAYRSYRDIGVAILHDGSPNIEVMLRKIDLAGDPDARILAGFLANLCATVGANTLLIDGPQAWKSPANGLTHSRICERTLNTPAKTGLPGTGKPKNYLPFIAFSIAVFDGLDGLGWPRFDGKQPPGTRIVAEVFPLSAWRSLKLAHLPAKKKCGPDLVSRHSELLSRAYPMVLDRTPNHDELQAVVAGLVGGPLSRRDYASMNVAGIAPFRHDGYFREGMIVNPLASEVSDAD